MIHNFADKLERSRAGATCEALLLNWITGCVSVKAACETDDRNGIDYWASLRGGAMVGIDHKMREKGCSKFWAHGVPELAMEKWSVMPEQERGIRGKVGWTLDEAKQTDYTLHTFHQDDSLSAYLLPFQHLRSAFRRNCDVWLNQYPAKIQRSDGWRSMAVFVPAPIILAAIHDEMEREPNVLWNCLVPL